jgi:uncharacterized protein
MSDGRSKLCDVSKLADAGGELTFDLPVADMERLRSVLASPEGRVWGTAKFARERGRPVAQLAFTAQLQLRCQRCLEAMPVEIKGGSLVHLVPDEAAAVGLPEDAEMLLAPDGKLQLAGLVEEDVLLSLPIAPRHEGAASSDGCGADSAPEAERDEAQQVQRPFAALEELMRSSARRGRGE